MSNGDLLAAAQAANKAARNHPLAKLRRRWCKAQDKAERLERLAEAARVQANTLFSELEERRMANSELAAEEKALQAKAVDAMAQMQANWQQPQPTPPATVQPERFLEGRL